MFKKGDRVVMVKGDRWASSGNVGVVIAASPDNDSTLVCWDGPKNYGLWHDSQRLDYETASTDPNFLFKRRQHTKESAGEE